MRCLPNIGFQGEKGAYGEEAISAYLGGQVSPVPYTTFAQVFEAVAGGAVDAALVPVGNNYAGQVTEVCRLLTQTNLMVTGVYQHPIRHCLLALPGQHLRAITRVMSHEQALAQCDTYLEALGVELVAFYDTAGAAKYIRERELVGVAAIASKRAASVYDLAILAEDVQATRDNATSFVLLCSAQGLLHEEYRLLCELQTVRAQERHDRAEALLCELMLRDQDTDWRMRHAS
jgi:prephenate dehydratase